MPIIIEGGPSGNDAEVDAYKAAQRVSIVPRAASYAATGPTGTIAAALAANSSVFTMRSDPAAGASYKIYIARIRVEFTTIVAFTTPITAARRLALFRGSGATPSGGTALTVVKKDTADGASKVIDARIATTGALTVTGVTFETAPIREMMLVHVGAAGAYTDRVWEFNSTDAGGELVLNQGELLAVRNPAAMDAAGTFQLEVLVDWFEGTV